VFVCFEGQIGGSGQAKRSRRRHAWIKQSTRGGHSLCNRRLLQWLLASNRNLDTRKSSFALPFSLRMPFNHSGLSSFIFFQELQLKRMLNTTPLMWRAVAPDSSACQFVSDRMSLVHEIVVNDGVNVTSGAYTSSRSIHVVLYKVGQNPAVFALGIRGSGPDDRG